MKLLIINSNISITFYILNILCNIFVCKGNSNFILDNFKSKDLNVLIERINNNNNNHKINELSKSLNNNIYNFDLKTKDDIVHNKINNEDYKNSFYNNNTYYYNIHISYENYIYQNINTNLNSNLSNIDSEIKYKSYVMLILNDKNNYPVKTSDLKVFNMYPYRTNSLFISNKEVQHYCELDNNFIYQKISTYNCRFKLNIYLFKNNIINAFALKDSLIYSLDKSYNSILPYSYYEPCSNISNNCKLLKTEVARVSIQNVPLYNNILHANEIVKLKYKIDDLNVITNSYNNNYYKVNKVKSMLIYKNNTIVEDEIEKSSIIINQMYYYENKEIYCEITFGPNELFYYNKDILNNKKIKILSYIEKIENNTNYMIYSNSLDLYIDENNVNRFIHLKQFYECMIKILFVILLFVVLYSVYRLKFKRINIKSSLSFSYKINNSAETIVFSNNTINNFQDRELEEQDTKINDEIGYIYNFI